MKANLVTLALLVCGVAASAAAPTYPPHVIGNSELRVLPVNAAGRHYQLSIGLPASYGSQPDRRYPVVYVTDGYWDFQKLDAIRGSLVFDQVVPEFIIVGIGYAGENLNYGSLRTWELSPVPFGNNAESGRAADFLQSIESEIIPFVEREYRADPGHRVLSGASLGGLFTLYSLYAKPGLFQSYIAVTPAVVVGNDWLMGFEEKFVQGGGQLKGRLYVTMGENEGVGFISGILRYNARVQSRKHPGLAYAFRIIDGERHAGMQMESYTRGLRFVFAPFAPEQGPGLFP
ncbi:Ferri-bacillibactin esterase BesA [Lacunisphaera limnophila]|uniref:Ferri-bacillibactin esterase BesA n=1 Tax=Lacunisphaera limnophila TaxID=1838286 RepID=A0A1D8AYN5_9BACT|nr:alpha/beta hydrolase-fold protein [Lacunisphaera limnophila]AOS45974.1 Ferri-bacillibactin esterase BesA [Lacunisphaera limnophila]